MMRHGRTVREYAGPTPDGEEIKGLLRYFINGWVPMFVIDLERGVMCTNDAAIPFTETKR